MARLGRRQPNRPVVYHPRPVAGGGTITAPVISGTPQTFAFSATPTTVTYTGGGSTGTDVFDILCVNSDATVATPAGWTLEQSRIGGQGAYIFTRNGGTGSVSLAPASTATQPSRGCGFPGRPQRTPPPTGRTASTPPPGPPPLRRPPRRWPPRRNSSSRSAPSTASAIGAPSGFSWSGRVHSSGSWRGAGHSGTGAGNSVGVKTPAGTAAESPTLTWTNNASDRYILIISFTGAASAGGSTLDIAGAGTSTSAATAAVTLTLAFAGVAASTTSAAGALGISPRSPGPPPARPPPPPRWLSSPRSRAPPPAPRRRLPISPG
jgi:hypothetical protein